jgi:hypothetical protein
MRHRGDDRRALLYFRFRTLTPMGMMRAFPNARLVLSLRLHAAERPLLLLFTEARSDRGDAVFGTFPVLDRLRHETLVKGLKLRVAGRSRRGAQAVRQALVGVLAPKHPRSLADGGTGRFDLGELRRSGSRRSGGRRRPGVAREALAPLDTSYRKRAREHDPSRSQQKGTREPHRHDPTIPFRGRSAIPDLWIFSNVPPAQCQFQNTATISCW